jgi:hypothetical protein
VLESRCGHETRVDQQKLLREAAGGNTRDDSVKCVSIRDLPGYCITVYNPCRVTES